MASRAIRRLNLLEYVILTVAAALALAAGALAALLLGGAFGWPFRRTWFVTSLLMFAVPALGAYLRDRRAAEERLSHRVEAAGGGSGIDEEERERNGR